MCGAFPVIGPETVRGHPVCEGRCKEEGERRYGKPTIDEPGSSRHYPTVRDQIRGEGKAKREVVADAIAEMREAVGYTRKAWDQ